MSFTSSDEHDAMDGELVCRLLILCIFVLSGTSLYLSFIIFRVLQLMNLTDARLQVSGGCEKLELAMLSFFEQFRKIYVGDQVFVHGV